MKFQFLPHYVKYIGLTLWIITGLPGALEASLNGLIDGWNGNHSLGPDTHTLGLPAIFHSSTFEILSCCALLLYALAKDKIFDEFMLKLRLESVYLMFFGTLAYILVSVMVGENWEMNAIYLFTAQMVFFLLVHKARKMLLRSAQSQAIIE